MRKWWIYQRERFPVAGHGPLILAFSGSALAFSALLHDDIGFLGGDGPWRLAIATAFLTCFGFFLQLRIADEFKDIEEDTRYRPYRPVPRGLVTLRELGVLFALVAAGQLALALWLGPKLAVVLVAGWSYLALMSVEFFARDWLKARPITYLWTHMLIMPIVDLYATACHWLVRDFGLHLGLKWFLVASFCNGIVIEIGRKLRRPADEEEGVQTYTVLWGRKAPWLWWGCMAVTLAAAAMAAREIRFVVPVVATLGAVWLVAGLCVWDFGRRDRSGKRFEALSGLWTLALDLILGLIPFGPRWRGL